jgi:2-oxoglutarate ferredoxin oxidoreductase subunit alpha
VNGSKVASAHIHHLNPLPSNLGDVMRSFDRVLLPEINSGQLSRVLRAEYLVDVESFCKVEGQPLYAAEIEREIEARQ